MSELIMPNVKPTPTLSVLEFSSSPNLLRLAETVVKKEQKGEQRKLLIKIICMNHAVCIIFLQQPVFFSL